MDMIEYRSVKDLRHSDHRPVTALMRVTALRSQDNPANDLKMNVVRLVTSDTPFTGWITCECQWSWSSHCVFLREGSSPDSAFNFPKCDGVRSRGVFFSGLNGTPLGKLSWGGWMRGVRVPVWR